MAANLSKKFSLLICCLMTMQALRLVISTAGFCVVRFHIDSSLFGIFISRLVNAVMVAQLFGNWLGDLFVFALSGQAKLYAAAFANWVEFACFCTALYSICHTECGHLNGFYWSMVSAYFWWKVGEAPATSIGGDELDWYFAGFTLSGVWGSCLKGLVMMCVGETGGVDGGVSRNGKGELVGIASVGGVIRRVKIVGARSVKTTVDYRASKYLFVIVIVLTFLMNVAWSRAAGDVQWAGFWMKKALTAAGVSLSQGTQINVTAQKESGSATKVVEANVQKDGGDGVTVTGTVTGASWSKDEEGKVTRVQTTTATKDIPGAKDWLTAQAGESGTNVTVKLREDGFVASSEGEATVLKVFVGIAFGGVLAVPGAMLGVGVGCVFALCFKCCLPTAKYASLTKWCQLIFGIVGAAGGVGASVALLTVADSGDPVEVWLASYKKDKQVKITTAGKPEDVWYWPFVGLGSGLALGALIGLIIGACKGKKKRGFWGGAFIGSFFGLISGEIGAGAEVRSGIGASFVLGPTGAVHPHTDRKMEAVWGAGMLIVVLGCGTVYSIYPGMAPCSITQFKYFDIIDISILTLSSIGPLVMMGIDLAEAPWKLSGVITGKVNGQPAGDQATNRNVLWSGIGVAVVMTLATNVCEILVLHIMQHPLSKTAQKVTTSGWRACTLTILMVSFQLTSTGVGFGCVAAGSAFNDGIMNVNSTLVLWTMECCAVLGEGYLTELKKYEPGKWPTQGMGKWETYKWWNRKAFGNAWQIWCCIGTTDLRRDIMLCRQ